MEGKKIKMRKKNFLIGINLKKEIITSTCHTFQSIKKTTTFIHIHTIYSYSYIYAYKTPKNG